MTFFLFFNLKSNQNYLMTDWETTICWLGPSVGHIPLWKSLVLTTSFANIRLIFDNKQQWMSLPMLPAARAVPATPTRPMMNLPMLQAARAVPAAPTRGMVPAARAVPAAPTHLTTQQLLVPRLLKTIDGITVAECSFNSHFPSVLSISTSLVAQLLLVFRLSEISRWLTVC